MSIKTNVKPKVYTANVNMYTLEYDMNRDCVFHNENYKDLTIAIPKNKNICFATITAAKFIYFYNEDFIINSYLKIRYLSTIPDSIFEKHVLDVFPNCKNKYDTLMMQKALR